MSTLAWLFILAAVILIRAAAKGRALDLPQDMSDTFSALVRGDSDALGEVFSRTGDALTASETDVSKYEATAVQGMGDIPATSGIAAAAIKRGTAARGYRWTATGPDYYDCSGLMWRACQDANVYNGPRFTTFTFGGIKGFTKVSKPELGDVVVWPTHHMGVVTGNDQYYSARSVKSGIGYSKISGYGGTHYFYRPNGRT